MLRFSRFKGKKLLETLFNFQIRYYSKRKNLNFADVPIENIRNIGIIAHVDAGKTTTAERMLYLSGIIKHMGDVDTGNTTMDFLDMERERGITIQSAAITFLWNDSRINMIDTPGHIDFQGEVERSVRVLDGAVTVVDGSKGVQAQTHTVWRQADRHLVPKIIFVNKMDQDDASVGRVLQSLKARLGVINALPLQIPVGYAENFKGVIDLIEQKEYIWDKEDINPISINEVTSKHKMYKQMTEAREKLLNTLADYDETIMNYYLEYNSEIPTDLIKQSIRSLTTSMKIIPLFCGSSLNKIGIQGLLEAIIDYLPSPEDRPPLEISEFSNRFDKFKGEKQVINPSGSDDLVILAFKVVHDFHRGMIVYSRIYSGSFHTGVKLLNVNRNSEERVLSLMRIGADEMQTITNIQAGDICALIGLKNVYTGDTLLSSSESKRKKALLVLPGVQLSPPVFTCAVEASEEKHEKKLVDAINSLIKEDPTVHFSSDPDSGQLLISGMGELHMEIIKDRLLNHYKVDAWIGKMQISYRTTINQTVEKTYDFVYQLTGDKQSATLSFTVKPASTEQYVENQIIIDIPKSSIATIPYHLILEIKEAIQEGIEIVLKCGPVFTFPLFSLEITVNDLTYHSDSSISAFRGCASKLMREILKEAEVIILQPIMRVEVTSPTEHLGSVLTDLTSKRKGNIIVVDDDINAKSKVIVAEAPLQYLLGYSTVLRSLSQGDASFSMEFLQYGELTENEVVNLRAEFTGNSRTHN